MSVRAKFVALHKSEGETGQVSLGAVVSAENNEENNRFFEFTPSGQISIGTVNKEAFAQSEVGKEYYVDFTPA